MGCDIHLHAEVRKSYSANGKQRAFWSRAVPAREDRDPWYNKDDAREHDPHTAIRSVTSWYGGRNYQLFGILAGVRGDDVPIAEPRGLPADLSDDLVVLRRDDVYTGDVTLGEHSFSWLTLAELMEHAGRIVTADEDFGNRVIPGLQKLDADPRNVRIVFGFDS